MAAANATVLYWFTGETFSVGQTFNHNAWVTPDVGGANAQVSTGTDTIGSGPDVGQTTNNAQSYAISIVTAPSPVAGRPGSKAVRFEVRRKDYKFSGHRAEFSLPHVLSGGVYWYAWSVYVPGGSDEPWEEILGQAHADDSVGASPPWAVARTPYIGTSRQWNGNPSSTMSWNFDRRGGSNPSTTTAYKLDGQTTNEWVDWVIQVKWARDTTGFINVWRNGTQVVSQSGIATDFTASDDWPYFKFGIYKWPWKQGSYTGSQPTRVAYFDEVKVGDASETYQSMAPRRSSGGSGISENFSSGAQNFSVISGGIWSVAGGKYVLSNPSTNSPVPGNGNIALHNTAISGDWTLTADASTAGTSSAWNDFSVIFGYQDANNYYFASFCESNDAATSGVFKMVNNVGTQIADISSLISAGTTYAIEITKAGTGYTVKRNGSVVASFSDSTYGSGYVGFGSRNDGASFDNLVVTP